MQDNTLKTCPFCGSPAEILHNKDGHTAIACTSTISQDCHLYSGWDERQNSDISWDDVMVWYVKEQDAFTAWNRRMS